MKNKLFVGNLDYSTTANDLRTVFKACGSIHSLKVITNPETGQSKGFAFIEYANEDGAERAIEAFNMFELNGRPLRVTYAEERQRAPMPSPTFSEAPPDFAHRGKNKNFRASAPTNYHEDEFPNRRPKSSDRRERGGGNRRRYQDSADWD